MTTEMRARLAPRFTAVTVPAAGEVNRTAFAFRSSKSGRPRLTLSPAFTSILETQKSHDVGTVRVKTLSLRSLIDPGLWVLRTRSRIPDMAQDVSLSVLRTSAT